MALENFNNYTEADEGSDVTVESATKVSWVDLYSRKETAYLYYNHSASPFDGDFTHKFETSFSNVGDNSRFVPWMLASAVGDHKAIRDGGYDAAYVEIYDETENIYGGFEEAGSPNTDFWAQPGPQPSTNYFITPVRDDGGGDNSTGLLTIHICTVAHYGEGGSELQDTLVIHASEGEQNDYIYSYALATYDDDGNVNTIDGYTQNMDLGIEAGGISIPVAMHHYKQMAGV